MLILSERNLNHSHGQRDITERHLGNRSHLLVYVDAAVVCAGRGRQISTQMSQS